MLERTWIARASRGDQAAFVALIEVYQTPVYNLCFWMLADPEGADAAAQETFDRAFRLLPNYRRENRFKIWLLRQALQVCLERMDPGCDPPLAGRVPGLDQTRPLECTPSATQGLHVLLSELSTPDRVCMVLYYCCDLPDSEIAAVSGTTVQEAGQRLLTARQKLVQAVTI